MRGIFDWRRFVGAFIGAVGGAVLSVVPTGVVLTVWFCVLRFVQHAIGRLDGPVQVAWNVTVITSMVGLFFLSTAVGVVAGGIVGARAVGSGSLRAAIKESRVFRFLSPRPM